MPATAVEAEIDRRMLLSSTLDQAAWVREFAKGAAVDADATEVIWFVVPRVFVATRPRVGGVVPRLTRPPILWRADELYVVK